MAPHRFAAFVQLSANWTWTCIYHRRMSAPSAGQALAAHRTSPLRRRFLRRWVYACSSSCTSTCQEDIPLHDTGDRAEFVEIAKQCFARLVRACLGQSAISNRKLEHGRELIVLGIQMCLDSDGVSFWPAPAKVDKWVDMICKSMLEGVCSCIADTLHSSVSCTVYCTAGAHMR